MAGDLFTLHASKAQTPTMGGLMISISVTVSVVLWARPNIYVYTALMVYWGLTIIGFCDDYLKISKGSSVGANLVSIVDCGQACLTIVALLILLNFLIRHLKRGNCGFHFIKI